MFQFRKKLTQDSKTATPQTVGDGTIKYRPKVTKVPTTNYIPKGYELKNSNIPGAGLGIYCTMDLPKGHNMGPYKGRWLSPEEYQKTNKELHYVWEIYDYRGNPNRKPGEKYDPNRAIGYRDAQNKTQSNFLRYLNHPRNDAEENVEAKQIKDNIHYFTKKPVKAGEELMVNYGPDYGRSLLGN